MSRTGTGALLLVLLLASGCAGRAPDADPVCPPGTRAHTRGLEGWCATSAGVPDGPFWMRFPDGTLRHRGSVRDGVVEGRWEAWHPNGVRSIEARYVGGELVGPFRLWDDAGRLVYAGAHDAQGAMHGAWTHWWPNGRVRTTWHMDHGRQHGPVLAFHESGAPRMAGERRDGLPHGRWTWWDASGAVTRSCRYDAGRLLDGPCGPSPRADEPAAGAAPVARPSSR